MPSDKHNSRMAAKATGSISHLSMSLCPEVCLFTNRSSHSTCIMVLPFTSIKVWGTRFTSETACVFLLSEWNTKVCLNQISHLFLLGCTLK